MGDIDVDLGALSTIARELDKAASGLDDLGGTVPTKVDAGLMTATVSAMLAQIVDSAGTVSTSCAAAADQVRECRSYYERTDAEASASLADIHKVMAP